MTELQLSASGEPADRTPAALPTLDARAIPQTLRHAAILGVVDSLALGSAFALVAPHNPLPLLRQIEKRHGASVSVAYLEDGPQRWTLRLERVSP